MSGDAECHGIDDAFPWHVDVYDAHCHVSNARALEENIQQISNMSARTLIVLATKADNQETTERLAEQYGSNSKHNAAEQSHDVRIVAGFGWHPWYAHMLYSDAATSDLNTLPQAERKMRHYRSVLTPLPDDDFLSTLPQPLPLSAFLAATRQRLLAHSTALVGEVGLDRAARIKMPRMPTSESAPSLPSASSVKRHLSQYRVTVPHQTTVLKAQLALAAEMGRAVSVHGVQAHGLLYEVLVGTWKGFEKERQSNRRRKRQAAITLSSNVDDGRAADQESVKVTYPPRICLHSYSGSSAMLKLYLDERIPAEMFFSFSTFNNFSHAQGNKAEAVVREVPDDMLLLESDMSHAGSQLDGQLDITARTLCSLKGWSLEEGLAKLRDNWTRFVYGKHPHCGEASA